MIVHSTAGADVPKVEAPVDTYDFGRVVAGAVVQPEFVVWNSGSAALRIENVRLSPELKILPSPAQVAPGSNTLLRFKLDTTSLTGPYDGVILLKLNDPETPEFQLNVTGDVIPEVECSPMPAFWVTATKGQTKQASIEIINHGSNALAIDKVEHPTTSFTTQLKTLEAGKRFQLILEMKPDGPVGKHAEPVLLYTNSAASAPLRVMANTYLRERVYTFPGAIDFGTWAIQQAETNANFLAQVTQTLMIYQSNKPADHKDEFLIHVTTDVPAIQLQSERGKNGDRYQLTFTLDKEKLKPGTLAGTIFIETTDPEFPQITVPISGRIHNGRGK